MYEAGLESQWLYGFNLKFNIVTYSEIYKLCKEGKIGLIPGWKGYVKWDYADDLLSFINGDYKMNEKELEKHIKNRMDLYYII